MNESAIKDAIDASDVASYLRRHPQFLNEYPDLALTLIVPREQGATTSLASYQLEVLRDKNQELTRRLRELVAIATENEQLMVRVHSLNIALMRETSLEASVRRIAASLTEDFDTDLIRLVLFGRKNAELPAADWLILSDAAEMPAFAEFLRRGDPLCGRLQPEKLDALFGDQAAQVRSAALVLIDQVGMLAIGSEDGNRFHPGMGTVFLKLIGESAAAAVTRFGAD